MQHGIVEGETGVFPIPIDALKRFFRRVTGRKTEEEPAEPREMPPFPERPPDPR